MSTEFSFLKSNYNCDLPNFVYFLYILSQILAPTLIILLATLLSDDAVLFYADRNIENLQFNNEKDFQSVEIWIELNKLTLNYKKTNCILISKQN